jgi:tRNA threonylcarbamoyladenosine biosynthesis protein TsaB
MLTDQPILAIETSQSLCSTCVYFSKDKYFEINFKLKNAHAEKLFDSIDYVLNSSKIKINEIGIIAVSSGPGSFTGLRIGMSAVKGIGFGSSLPVIPVPTFEALAFQICDYVADDTEFVIANKVNVEEIYFAKFKKDISGPVFIEKLQVINHKEAEEKSAGTLIFGNALLDSGNNLLKTRRGSSISSPGARYLAEWSIHFGEKKILYNYDYLEPVYIKNFVVKEKKDV